MGMWPYECSSKTPRMWSCFSRSKCRMKDQDERRVKNADKGWMRDAEKRRMKNADKCQMKGAYKVQTLGKIRSHDIRQKCQEPPRTNEIRKKVPRTAED